MVRELSDAQDNSLSRQFLLPLFHHLTESYCSAIDISERSYLRILIANVKILLARPDDEECQTQFDANIADYERVYGPIDHQ